MLGERADWKSFWGCFLGNFRCLLSLLVFMVTSFLLGLHVIYIYQTLFLFACFATSEGFIDWFWRHLCLWDNSFDQVLLEWLNCIRITWSEGFLQIYLLVFYIRILDCSGLCFLSVYDDISDLIRMSTVQIFLALKGLIFCRGTHTYPAIR